MPEDIPSSEAAGEPEEEEEGRKQQILSEFKALSYEDQIGQRITWAKELEKTESEILELKERLAFKTAWCGVLRRNLGISRYLDSNLNAGSSELLIFNTIALPLPLVVCRLLLCVPIKLFTWPTFFLAFIKPKLKDCPAKNFEKSDKKISRGTDCFVTLVARLHELIKCLLSSLIFLVENLAVLALKTDLKKAHVENRPFFSSCWRSLRMENRT